MTGPTVDTLGRALTDLRISVTDRCNFRCRYCMPREAFGAGHAFLERSSLLTFEEIARVTRVFAALGTRKLRLTGGEPLVRAELPTLVRMLADIGGLDLALTTNGSLLARDAFALAEAGLSRVTVSLDALDDTTFRRMTDSDATVAQVIAGIAAATSAGLDPVKVNCVVKRAINEHAVLDLARHFRGTGIEVRFIEYMDVGITNGWRMAEVVSAAEMIRTIDRVHPLEPIAPKVPNEVARRYRYRDGAGEVGVITSVTAPFCGSCTRARLSADGQLFTCLFATTGTDLRATVRERTDDEALRTRIVEAWSARGDRYSELRSSRTRGIRRIEMSYIGG